MSQPAGVGGGGGGVGGEVLRAPAVTAPRPPQQQQQQQQMQMHQQPLQTQQQQGAPPGYANSAPIVQTANMYSQLESMMAAVKKEAGALEAVKQKIREMDSLRERVTELKGRLEQAEGANSDLKAQLQSSEAVSAELRGDMQRLNDIYNAEHAQFLESQATTMRLDQELKGLQHEAGFFQREAQKIPELRKKNQALTAQMAANAIKAEEDKAALVKEKAALEKQLEEAAKAKAETNAHFWNLTEEIKEMKKQIGQHDEGQLALQQEIKAAQQRAAVSDERAMMVGEDQLGFVERQRLEDNRTKAEMVGLRAEADSLRAFLATKDDAHIALTAKLRSLEEARVGEKNEVKAKMAQFTETISALKSKNHELERECSEAQHRLGLIGGDVSRYTVEVEHLQSELNRSEMGRKEKEAELNRELKTLAAQRDDAMAKLQVATQQFEAMQNQARDGQSRYWEELQRVKEAEAQLTDEAEHLTKELQEKTLKLVTIEAEKAKLEEYMRGEVTGATQMTGALRAELERRLEELTQTRKERDSLHSERDELNASLTELKGIMNRNEASFKKALETDRAKVQAEIKGKMARLRGLEGEKQELLHETTELMNQAHETTHTHT